LALYMSFAFNLRFSFITFISICNEDI
jgi:hypothetical protein